ncbi:NAD-dependent succinate-semialdehyde dehydrogenase, partial [Rickettsiales bacterium]|nr:NAD-dependent succinate-semialdehyde dehydrogenase [Rickettsiales bacterium]
IQKYSYFSNKKAADIIEKTQKAFLQYKNFNISQKSQAILEIAQKLEQNKEQYSQLISLEMGKIPAESISEIEKCIDLCKYYAKNGPKFLNDEYIDKNQKQFITYQPLGLVFAIMPWNFPFWQVFRFAIPALIAGNGCILKHADNVSGCSLALERIFSNNNLPENIFRSLLIKPGQVNQIIANKYIKATSFTGSTKIGKKIAQQSAKYLKKTVLELGGSDPYIILKDANIKKAAKLCAKSRLMNAGQSCVAAKRFIAVKEIYQEFLKHLISEMEKFQIGNNSGSKFNIAPQSSKKLRDNLHKQVKKSIKMGGKCLMGGKIPKIPGYFYPPTIIENPKKGSPAYNEELFGPVATIIKAHDEKEAIKIANDSEFGLGSAIFSSDIKKATNIAKHNIESGICFINDLVKSSPEAPFGGIKNSGYGRELSYFGIKEFTNIKYINVQ